MQTAALFDLDGVIVDTEGQYTEFWKRVGNQDFPNVPDFAFRIKGHTLTQILMRIILTMRWHRNVWLRNLMFLNKI